MMENSIELPQGWVECIFGDIANMKKAIKSKDFIKNGTQNKDDIPLVRQSQLKGDIVDLSEAVYPMAPSM